MAMGTRMSERNLARGLFAVVIATLLTFTGLAPADAGITIMQNPRVWFVPGEITATGWASSLDIENEPTGAAEDEAVVGSIHDGDWTQYVVLDDGDMAASRRYVVSARVASATSGGIISISFDGMHVGSIEVSGTGGWQNWTTVNTTIELPLDTNSMILTYNGDGDGELLKLSSLTFERAPERPLREEAVDDFVEALESYGDEHGTYRVHGGGHRGKGNAWAFYEGKSYPKSTANVLIEGGHLSPEPVRDELWTDHTSIIGDVLVYTCKDRVAVFTREGNGQPSVEDRAWWDANGCLRYPIDRLGVSYFALSSRL